MHPLLAALRQRPDAWPFVHEAMYVALDNCEPNF